MPEMTDEQIEAVKDTCRSIVQNMEGDSLFGSAFGAITTLQRQCDGMQIMAEGFKAQLTEALAAKDAMQAVMVDMARAKTLCECGCCNAWRAAFRPFFQPAPDPLVELEAKRWMSNLPRDQFDKLLLIVRARESAVEREVMARVRYELAKAEDVIDAIQFRAICRIIYALPTAYPENRA